ncbi:MAG: hypothetical protein RsTaC01_1054 [Candidatus Paraimprobicoccus trichonymphae]|uniref:Uncharacterized protein n=1 Tax=Candidatus Paraimprobicoccus trichonymphae TaxID=3033793 RepID=A0AA48I0E1_9FIRM|nr:MAG: hypothetical protein RsTaC01_1054 [Candidatus Paraimprobicoccus trichonymphae]
MKSLEKLSELFVGKTGLLNHEIKSENQTARIFSTYLEKLENKFNKLNQDYYRLVAKAYMPKSKKNEDFILYIDSGIIKEVSVGCAVKNKICSICNEKIDFCNHIKGKKYSKNLCYVILDDPIDAYEWSFVAVPEQINADVIKSLKIKDSNFDKSLDNKFFTKFIKNLQKKAEIGEIYEQDLKKQVIKYSMIVQSEMSQVIKNSILDKLTFQELKDLRDCYRLKASEILPISPQLSSNTFKNNANLNNEFKI